MIDIDMSKKVYALITEQCNLSCPHCNIRMKDESFNANKFTRVLKDFNGLIVIFGGEPTLHQDRLFDCIINIPEIRAKIQSISTNLIILNDELITLYEQLKFIASSWNPNRFTHSEYARWLTNINILEGHDVHVSVLVTLTEDLFTYGVDRFMSMISTWNHSVISDIRFEYLVADGLTKAYYEAADRWLCEVYSKWTCKIPMDISNVKNWYFDCSETYTLYPDGTLVNRCPNHRYANVPVECYTCDRSDICRPCCLHDLCSFPKNLYRLILEREHENDLHIISDVSDNEPIC